MERVADRRPVGAVGLVRVTLVVVVPVAVAVVDAIDLVGVEDTITVVVRDPVADLFGVGVGVLVGVVAVRVVLDVALGRGAGDDAVGTAVAVTVEILVPGLRVVRGTALVDVAVAVIVDPIAHLLTGGRAGLLVLVGRGAGVDLFRRFRDRGDPVLVGHLFAVLGTLFRLVLRNDVVLGAGDEKETGQNATHGLCQGPWPGMSEETG